MAAAATTSRCPMRDAISGARLPACCSACGNNWRGIEPEGGRVVNAGGGAGSYQLRDAVWQYKPWDGEAAMDSSDRPPEPRVGLVLTGGGARAAYQVGVLR